MGVDDARRRLDEHEQSEGPRLHAVRIEQDLESPGASRRDLPPRFYKWERAYHRYRRWSDTGL